MAFIPVASKVTVPGTSDPLPLTLSVLVLTVDGFIDSLKVTLIVVYIGTFAASRAGTSVSGGIAGGVVSGAIPVVKLQE
jgi:hypothetical protein